jgi:hypothetical protein
MPHAAGPNVGEQVPQGRPLRRIFSAISTDIILERVVRRGTVAKRFPILRAIMTNHLSRVKLHPALAALAPRGKSQAYTSRIADLHPPFIRAPVTILHVT